MSRTFWHFGDSYACFTNADEKNFGELLADRFHCDSYVNKGKSGFSNEMIFSNIIKNSNNFKENDIVFVNWSFFSRTSFANDDTQIKSTNEYVDDYIKKITHENNDVFDFLKKYSYIVEYLLFNNYDIATKLFLGLINPFFKTLIDRNIIPISLFIEEDGELYMNKNTVGKFNELGLLPPNTLEFMKITPYSPGSFIRFLEGQGHHNEENGHYTDDSQNIIFETISPLMVKFINNI